MKAGIGIHDIAVPKTGRLAGSPLMPRAITGIHDPLQVSALHLRTGVRGVLLISADLFGIDPYNCQQITEAVEQSTSVRRDRVFLGCTNTHSSPIANWPYTGQSADADARPDAGFVDAIKRAVVAAAASACATTRPVELATAVARHVGPGGVGAFETPVLALREPGDHSCVAVVCVCGIRPDSVRPDSSVVSADFPAVVRRCIHEGFKGQSAILHFTAPSDAWNHAIRPEGGAFLETETLGDRVGQAVLAALEGATWRSMENDVNVDVATRNCEMVFRELPAVAVAEKEWRLAQMDVDRLESPGAPAKAPWTAHRDLARAEGVFQLARQKQQGALNSLLYMYGSGDVKVLRIDRELIVGMPGTLAPYYARWIREKCGRSVPVAGHVSGHLPGELLEPETEARGEFAWVPSPFAAASAVKMADAAAALIAGA